MDPVGQGQVFAEHSTRLTVLPYPAPVPASPEADTLLFGLILRLRVSTLVTPLEVGTVRVP